MNTFVAELAIKTTESDKKYLWKISDCARQLQNVCLAESLKRLKQIKRTKLYKKTIQMSKSAKRTKNFNYLNEKFGFRKYDIEKFGTQTKNNSKFIGVHLGSQACQKIAVRAFEAVQKLSFSRSKKVHFKPKGEFVSFEGKTNATFLRYSNGYALIGKRSMKCIINPKDIWLQHALNQRIKYCRLVRKVIKGKEKFYLQLILEGTPYQKYTIGEGVSGLDIGPSTFAFVGKTKAILKEFCDELTFYDNEKRKLLRKQDRRRRMANPNNFNKDGTIRKGKKTWVYSKNYIKTQKEIAETERKLTERRKQLHGRDANIILQATKIVKTEKLSYKAFQKLFGRSVGRRAPSAFIRLLERKLSYQGGSLMEFSTFSTKLSQTCQCGLVVKKKLSDRWHSCACGVKSQRDLYSAFLAAHVNEKETLELKDANNNWLFMREIINKEIERLKELKKTRKLNSSFGF